MIFPSHYRFYTNSLITGHFYQISLLFAIPLFFIPIRIFWSHSTTPSTTPFPQKPQHWRTQTKSQTPQKPCKTLRALTLQDKISSFSSLPAASSAVRTWNTAFLFDFRFPRQNFHRRRFWASDCPLLVSHLKTDFFSVNSDLYRINMDFFRMHAALIKHGWDFHFSVSDPECMRSSDN